MLQKNVGIYGTLDLWTPKPQTESPKAKSSSKSSRYTHYIPKEKLAEYSLHEMLENNYGVLDKPKLRVNNISIEKAKDRAKNLSIQYQGPSHMLLKKPTPVLFSTKTHVHQKSYVSGDVYRWNKTPKKNALFKNSARSW